MTELKTQLIEIRDAIKKCDEKYVLNLSDEENFEDQFIDAMSSIFPATGIAFSWSSETEQGHFYVNLELKETIEDPEEKEEIKDLIREIEGLCKGCLDPYSAYIVKCPSCGEQNIELETPEHAEYYKNNTIYHLPCGYPRAVYDYEQITSKNTEQALKIARETENEEAISFLIKLYPE